MIEVAQLKNDPTTAPYVRRLSKAMMSIQSTAASPHRMGNDFDALLQIGVDLADLDVTVDASKYLWVRLATAAGASWKQIGDALGVSKQAAQKRYAGVYVDAPLPLET